MLFFCFCVHSFCLIISAFHCDRLCIVHFSVHSIHITIVFRRMFSVHIRVHVIIRRFIVTSSWHIRAFSLWRKSATCLVAIIVIVSSFRVIFVHFDCTNIVIVFSFFHSFNNVIIFIIADNVLRYFSPLFQFLKMLPFDIVNSHCFNFCLDTFHNLFCEFMHKSHSLL